MSDCYSTVSGCVICPGSPAIAGHPPSVSQTPIIGWGAGAYSVDRIDGDLRVVFTMPNVTGAACGLQSVVGSIGEPSAIDFGFFFHTGGLFRPIEFGAALLNDGDYAAGDTFEVRRSLEVVTYWRNNKLVHTSSRRSVGSMFVSGALYASGDQIG